MYLRQTTAVPGGREAAGEEAGSLCQHCGVCGAQFILIPLQDINEPG